MLMICIFCIKKASEMNDFSEVLRGQSDRIGLKIKVEKTKLLK